MKKDYLFTVGIVVGILLVIATWFDIININPYREHFVRLSKKYEVIKHSSTATSIKSEVAFKSKPEDFPNSLIDSSTTDFGQFINDSNCCDDIITNHDELYTE